MTHIYTSNGREYDVERLWDVAADLPIEVYDIRALEHCLAMGVWTDDFNFEISPFEVVQYIRNSSPQDPVPIELAYHVKAICTADLSYPILLHYEDGSLQIADGNHRLARCHLDNVGYINVRILNNAQLERARIMVTGPAARA